jgi:hypothetical protein
MIRKKRLSPRRASSRLPLSPRQTQVRLKPLLFLRPLPPKGGTPRERDSLASAPITNTPFFDARPEVFRSSVRLRRMSSCPTARLWRKSTVCGLNRFLPTLRVGALHLNPRPPVRGSCSDASLRRAQTSTAFPFWKQKLRLAHFFSPKRNPKDSGREAETKANGPTETVTAIQLNN